MLCVMTQALLNKQPLRRPCCEQLLQHPFLREEEPKEAEASTSASKVSHDNTAAREGVRAAHEGSSQKSSAAPSSAPGLRVERGQTVEQPSLAPSSARYA